jgi:hypothetical protein
MSNHRAYVAAAFTIAALAVPVQWTPAAEKVPILYSSDLYHPHADPDDHYDLATLFALEELNVRGIILDNVRGGQATRCGRPWSK